MKFRLGLLVLGAAMAFTAAAGTPVTRTELPSAALTFIDTHFADDGIRKAEKDHGLLGAEYEVDLVSGVELEFNSDGQWKEVKAGRGTTVPAAIVPAAIKTYVATHFADRGIVEIKRDRLGFEVELADDTDLFFKADGTYIGHTR